MIRSFQSILLLFAIILFGCSNKKEPQSHYYYVVAEDLTIKPTYDKEQYVSKQPLSAETDSAIVSDIMLRLYCQLTVESEHFEKRPHDYVINIFKEDGQLLDPSPELVEKCLDKWDNRKSSTWHDPTARDYYQENTNLFHEPYNMFSRGRIYADDHEKNLYPLEEIQALKLSEGSKQKGGLSSFWLFIGIAAVVGLIWGAISALTTSKKKESLEADRSDTLFPHNNASSIPQSSDSSLRKILDIEPKITMLNREGDIYADEWHTYIAGLPYRASFEDIGGFFGWVVNDITNTHDSNAMGVYNSSLELLGYIPEKKLSSYRKWCNGDPEPCVGFIYLKDGDLRGYVKIIKPCNSEFIEKEYRRYFQWVAENFGTEYVPDGML